MKNKKNATKSQYNYMVTGLLAAKIQHNGAITPEDIKSAVLAAEMAFELISDKIGDDEDDDGSSKPRKKEIINYFEDYIWEDGAATWSELAAYLHRLGIRSNRRITNIFHESLEKGYIRKDEANRKYLPPLP